MHCSSYIHKYVRQERGRVIERNVSIAWMVASSDTENTMSSVTVTYTLNKFTYKR